MTDAELAAWRKAGRERLIESRMALAPEDLTRHRVAIDAAIEDAFPDLARGIVAFCWPYRNEYDARFLARRLRARGATTALPVVVAPRKPLLFREWHPGITLAKGVYDIPYPAESAAVTPATVLLPMNGFDAAGFRLGYGGGYFDRTLAALDPAPLVIGLAYECARLETIHPQPYDIPVDYVVTERGLYERREGALVFPGAPPASRPAQPRKSG